MKFIKKQSTTLLLTLMSAAALTACGGGSGGSDTAEVDNASMVAQAQQDDSAATGSESSDLVVAAPADGDDGEQTETVADAGTGEPESSDALEPVLAASSTSSTSSKSASLIEKFDGTTTSFGNAVIAHKNVDLVSGQGVGGTKAIKVKYVGNSEGSERVLVSYKLPKAKVYTLNFDVKFCSGFDFAKGGKLHGLGPLNPVAGGNSVPSTGYSGRGMFNGDGAIQSYVYSQNMKGQYGDVVRSKTFKFQPGRYYAVSYQVGLNDPASQSNGFMRIYIDGTQVVNHTGIKFRGSSVDSTMIQTLMFNTFHGGHDSSWAPRNADGSYKTDCAYYDNFAAYPFARVRTALGS